MKKSEQPLISVIVPVYKVEKWLGQCVDSIMRQTYPNLEILLVDDGSPDRCGELCDQFARLDARIKVIHKANGGLSDARNCGLDRAAGEYICFVDSDDYIETSMIETMYAAIEQTEASVAVCNFTYQYEDPQEGPLDPVPYQITREGVLTGREFILLKQQKYIFCIVNWNKLYRREIFQTIRFPLGKVHEDEFVFHEIFYPCQRVVCIPYVGYHYRIRKNSIMEKGGKRLHILQALIERCRYFARQNDAELVCLTERELAALANVFLVHGPRAEKKELETELFALERELYQKRMISRRTLAKRRAAAAGMRLFGGMRRRSAGFEQLVQWGKLLLRGR